MTRTVELLDRLVAFDTVSENSNLELVEFVDNYLCERGFTTFRMPAPCGEKAGLLATTGQEGEGILLSAHSDVVPVTGQSWRHDPFRLRAEGDRLYGRGTTDMKGFLASMLALADRAAGSDLREPLKFSVSYDEEVGCVGIARMVDALPGVLGRPRACIVGEPTSMRVAIGHKGKAAFRAVCRGQSGHSALAPRYVNAIDLATDFVRELRDLQQWFLQHGVKDTGYDIPYSTLHVGRLSAGTATNIVPELAEIGFEYRHLPTEEPGEVMDRIRAAADQAASRYREMSADAAIKIIDENSYPGLDVSADAEIVRLVSSFAGTDETTKVVFGTEAGYFDGQGIPTVICGPGSMSEQGHKPDEYIARSELAACDVMMDRILISLT